MKWAMDVAAETCPGFPASEEPIACAKLRGFALGYQPFTVQARTPGGVFAWPGLEPIALPTQAGQVPHVDTMRLSA